jgi:hypothetical protein
MDEKIPRAAGFLHITTNRSSRFLAAGHVAYQAQAEQQHAIGFRLRHRGDGDVVQRGAVRAVAFVAREVQGAAGAFGDEAEAAGFPAHAGMRMAGDIEGVRVAAGDACGDDLVAAAVGIARHREGDGVGLVRHGVEGLLDAADAIAVQINAVVAMIRRPVGVDQVHAAGRDGPAGQRGGTRVDGLEGAAEFRYFKAAVGERGRLRHRDQQSQRRDRETGLNFVHFCPQ